VASHSSCFLVTGGLGRMRRVEAALAIAPEEVEGAMDWLERSFMALTLLGAVGAAVSIAWIMLI